MNQLLTHINLRSVLCTLYLLLCTWYTHAQDYKSDMERMYQRYSEATQLSMNFTVQMISEGNSSSQKAKIIKYDGNYYYDFQGIQLLITSKSMVMLSQPTHSMTYQKIDKKSYDQVMKGLLTYNVDSLLTANANKVTFSGEKNGIKTYTFKASEGYITEGSFAMNTATGFLSHIQYQLDKDVIGTDYEVKVNIHSSKQVLSADIQKTKLSTYVLGNGNKLVPSEKYKGYGLSIVEN